MKFPIRRTLAVMAVAAALAAWVSPLGATDIFRARMLTGKAPVEPALVNIQIEITGWTTPQEVVDLQRVLNEKGFDAFMAAFSAVDKGVVRFMYSRGWNMPIHAAQVVPTEKGKKVTIFLNRQGWDPGSYQKLGRNFFMVIEFTVNQKGKGDGRFYEDARVRLDSIQGIFDMETYESSPKIIPIVQEVVKKPEARK
jgi:hypothetical protein